MAETTDLASRMTHKVGPLPAWAWAAIPAVGYIGWSYYKAAKGDTTATDTTTPTDTTGVTDYGINPGGSYLPSYSATPYGSANPPYIDPPQYTNTTWSRQAINYLIGQGISSGDAVTAINAYINGVPSTINSTQMAALQRAIAQLGPAPETAFLPGTSGTPTPVTTVKVPEQPTTVRAVQVGKGARVTWGPPQQLGGSPVIGYKVEMYAHSATTGTPVQGDATKIGSGSVGWSLKASQLLLPTARAASFATLAPKTWYQARVSARNSKGYGPSANASVHIA
jgi:hypothetical protein